MAMQPLPVHRSSTRPTRSGASQGWKPASISSASGERGISTRSSTKNGSPQNQACPVRYGTGTRSLARLTSSAT
jgi:hypothetical protein